jgi:hypothetical protein
MFYAKTHVSRSQFCWQHCVNSCSPAVIDHKSGSHSQQRAEAKKKTKAKYDTVHVNRISLLEKKFFELCNLPAETTR